MDYPRQETPLSPSSHTPKLSIELRRSVSSHLDPTLSPEITPLPDKPFTESVETYMSSLEYTQNYLRQYIDPPPGFGNKVKQDSMIFTPEDSSAPDGGTNLGSLDDLASETDFGRESIHGGLDLDPRDIYQECRKYKGLCRRLQARLLDIQQVTGLYYDQGTQLILDQINTDSDFALCVECERVKKLNEHLMEQLQSDSEWKHGDPLYCSRKEYNEVVAIATRLTEEKKALQELIETEAAKYKELERHQEENTGSKTQLKAEIESLHLQIEELQDYIRKADFDNSLAIQNFHNKYKSKKRKLKEEIRQMKENNDKNLSVLEERIRYLTGKLREMKVEGLEEAPICTTCSELGVRNSRLEDRVRSLEQYIKTGGERMITEEKYRELEAKTKALEEKMRESLPGLKVVARVAPEVMDVYEQLFQLYHKGDLSDWNRDCGRLLQCLGTALTQSELSQSTEHSQSGRELRQKVHLQVVKIEEMMNEMQGIVPGIEPLREQYLQLPYLLKPIFDLLKNYEKKWINDVQIPQISTKNRQISTEKGTLETKLEQKETELNAFRQRCVNLEGQIKQLEKSVQFNERKTSILKRDNDSLRGKILILQSYLTEMQNRAESSVSLAELAKYKEKLEGYRKKLEEHKEREGQLQKELQQLREFADYQSHQAMIVNERAEELRQQNEALRLENDDLKNSY